jgi:hypothetical protein
VESEAETERNMTTSDEYATSTSVPYQPSSTESDKVENSTVTIATMSEDKEVESEEDPGDVSARLTLSLLDQSLLLNFL